jgi:hypothetical protein
VEIISPYIEAKKITQLLGIYEGQSFEACNTWRYQVFHVLTCWDLLATGDIIELVNA